MDDERKRLDVLVAEMICRYLQTLSVVEDLGFKNLVKALEP
jgi:hypothetical protein